MTQHDPLGRLGGSRRELENGERSGVNRGRPPLVGELGRDPLGGDPTEVSKDVGPLTVLHVMSEDRPGRKYGGSTRGRRHCLEPLERAVGPGRIRGHGHRAAIQASEEGREEFDAGRVEEEDALAGEPLLLNPGADGPRSLVERFDRQGNVVVLAVAEERERGPVRVCLGLVADQVDEGCGLQVLSVHERVLLLGAWGGQFVGWDQGGFAGGFGLVGGWGSGCGGRSSRGCEAAVSDFENHVGGRNEPAVVRDDDERRFALGLDPTEQGIDFVAGP